MTRRNKLHDPDDAAGALAEEVERLETENATLRIALQGLLDHHDAQLDRSIGGWDRWMQESYRNSPDCVRSAREALGKPYQLRT